MDRSQKENIWKKIVPREIGPYKILEEIGSGGMGRVYKCFHHQLERTVAIKVMLPDVCDKKRFLLEAKTMARLKHPHIISIYDFGSYGDIDYIVMEFIEGESLASLLKRSRLSIRRCLEIIKEVAYAIEYAHRHKIIHRDLKPANLMIERGSERVVVMDFGLAKNVSKKKKDLTKSKDIIGTPRYMAPEQVRGENISPLIDIYALGIILYETFSGIFAVQGKTPANIMYNVVHIDPTPLRQVNPNVTIDVETICHKAIEKDPSRRYQSVLKFAKDIECVLNGEIINARPTSAYYRYWRKAKKQKWAALVGGICLLLTILSIFIENIRFSQNLNQKVKFYLNKAEQILKPTSIEGLGKQISNKKNRLRQNKKMEIIEAYMKASDFLEKVLNLTPNSKIENKLYKLQKNIGLLALEEQNYLLSHIAFQRCKKLRNTKEIAKLLKSLAKNRSEVKEKQLQYIDKIMNKVGKRSPQQEIINWYVTKVSRMQGSHVVARLLHHLKSKNQWQRRIAIKALGQLGDKHTKVEEKDSVGWLLKHLKKIVFHKNGLLKLSPDKKVEILDIIWALGWLRDSRANRLVYKIRWHSGKFTPFWDRTKIPYSWIPVASKEKIKSLKELMLKGGMKQDKGDLEGAIVDYSQVIKLNPKDPSAYISRGLARYEKGYFKDAFADYSQAIKLNSRDFLAYNNRGLVRKKQGDFAGAIADFSQAIKLNPTYSSAYINRGVAYEKKGYLGEAITDHSKAIKLNPRYSRAYINRGVAYQKKGDLEKAIFDFSQAIKLNPTYSSAYNNRGGVRHKKGDLKGAFADYSQAIKLNPRNSLAYNNRAMLRRKTGDFVGAIADYSQAIKLNSRDSEAYNYRGLARYRKGYLVGAISDFSQAIKLNPKYAIAYNYRGGARYMKGDSEGAISDLSQAIKLYPKYSEAYHNRGNIYFKKRNFERAIFDYSQAIKLYPKDLKAYKNRGFIYAIKGDWNKSALDYNKTIQLSKSLDPYTFLLIINMLKRLNNQKALKEMLEKCIKLKKPKNIGWYIVRYYIGTISKKKLFVIANKEYKGKRGRLCKFYFYMGIDYLVQGNEKNAKKYLKKCLEYKVRGYLEPILASADLRRLRLK